jgi:hypothetical protein
MHDWRCVFVWFTVAIVWIVEFTREILIQLHSNNNPLSAPVLGSMFIHWRIVLTHVAAYILHTTLILHSSQLVIAAAYKLHVWCCGKMAELVPPWAGEVYVLSVWPGLRGLGDT